MFKTEPQKNYIPIQPFPHSHSFQAFYDLNNWVNCTGGWFTLPSGNMICYVKSLLPYLNRTNYCDYMGGTLLEIYTQEDFTMLMHIVKRLIDSGLRSNTTIFAVGGQAAIDNNSTVLVWKNSRTLVDYSNYGMIKPYLVQPQSVLSSHILFLKPMYYNISGFSFNLYGYPRTDYTAEFICMKPGNYAPSQCILKFSK
jgi:hypothetical protein